MVPSIYEVDGSSIAEAYRAYQLASGAGALFELQGRMLAEVSPSIGPDIAHSKRFNEPFLQILGVYAAELGEDGIADLKAAKKLRDTVVHADFAVADKKHREVTGPGTVPDGGVVQINIAGLKGPEMLERLIAGEGQSVAAMKKTKDGSFFGWLLEIRPQLPIIEQRLLEGAGRFYQLAEREQ